MAEVRTRSEVETEIKEELGLVPSFFSRIPDDVLDLEWEIMKRVELGETLIPNKYKELIGVAVHSETKCRYCTLFHTKQQSSSARPTRRSRKPRDSSSSRAGGASTSTASKWTTTC
jgi:hypothetical protein